MKRAFILWLLWLVGEYEKEVGDGKGNEFYEWCLSKILENNSEDGNK